MNTKVNWTKATLMVVLAIASLSSIAMSAPHPYRAQRRILAADLCGVTSVSMWDQYLAAVDLADLDGTEMPLALSESCVADGIDITASLADLGGDSGLRWEQYSAAIEGTVIELPERDLVANEGNYWEQVFGWNEPSPSAFSAAEESSVLSRRDLVGSEAYWGQVFGWAAQEFLAPANSTDQVRTFAPGAPTDEHDLDLFAKYLDLVANRGRGPTFASEADRGMPE